MPINESLIDKRIRQTIGYSSESDMRLKFAALAASEVVGKYDGTTQMIAFECNRNVSTVENWAHAAKLKKELIAFAVNPALKRHIRFLWHKLPVSHWWMAYGEIHKRGWDAFRFLNMAYQHAWSGSRMITEFEKEYETLRGEKPPKPMVSVYRSGFNFTVDILSRIGEAEPRIVSLVRQLQSVFTEMGIGSSDEA